MKKLLLSILIIGFHLVSFAQSGAGWDWVSTSGVSVAPASQPTDLAVDASGNTYAIGQYSTAITLGAFSLPTPTGRDIFIVKYNAAGTVQWLKRHTPPTGYNELSKIITVDASGDFYIGGTDDTPTLSGRSFFAKYDTNGNMLWNKFLTLYEVCGINLSADGNLILMENGQGATNILKVNKTDGTVIWKVESINAGSNSGARFKDLMDAAGNIYYTCFTASATTVKIAGEDMVTTGLASFIVSLDNNGQKRWIQTIPNIQVQLGYTVDEQGKSYIVFGGGGGGAFQGIPTTTGTNRYFELDNNGTAVKYSYTSPYLASGSMFRVKNGFVYSVLTDQAGYAGTRAIGDYLFNIPATNTFALGFVMKYDASNGQNAWVNSFEINGSAWNSGALNILEIGQNHKIAVGGSYGSSIKFANNTYTATASGTYPADLFIAQFDETLTPVPQITKWTGSAANGLWNDAANWDNGIPNGAKKTVITGGLSSYPTTIPSNATPAKIEIASGAKIQLPVNFSAPQGIINNGTIEINEVGSFTGTFGTTGIAPSGSGKIVIKNAGLAFYFPGGLNQSLELDFTGTASAYGGTINGDLILTKGILNISFEMYPLLVNNNIIGGSAASYIAGKLTRKVNANGVYTFPVGTTDRYAPISIQLKNITGPQTIVASFSKTINGAAPNTTAGGKTVTSLLNAGIWTVTPNVALASGSYGITLNGTGYTNGVADARNYVVLKRNNSSSAWGFYGDNGTAASSGGIVTATAGNITGFSDFAIGIASGDVPVTLPVKLIDFTAKTSAREVLLNWKTASEMNSEKFLIERSIDGKLFENIGMVASKGTTNNSSTYSYIDDKAIKGYNYYRLKQLDFNGDFEYSEIRTVKFDLMLAAEKLVIYPNPVTKYFKIANAESAATVGEIYDFSGKQLARINGAENEFSLPASLNNGWYVVKVVYQNGTVSQHKIIVKR